MINDLSSISICYHLLSFAIICCKDKDKYKDKVKDKDKV